MIEQTLRHLDSAIRFRSTVGTDFLREIFNVILLYAPDENISYWEQMVKQHENFLDRKNIEIDFEQIDLPPHTD
jgi:hypothetical protein